MTSHTSAHVTHKATQVLRSPTSSSGDPRPRTTCTTGDSPGTRRWRCHFRGPEWDAGRRGVQHLSGAGHARTSSRLGGALYEADPCMAWTLNPSFEHLDGAALPGASNLRGELLAGGELRPCPGLPSAVAMFVPDQLVGGGARETVLEKNRSGPSRSYSCIARNTSSRATWPHGRVCHRVLLVRHTDSVEQAASRVIGRISRLRPGGRLSKWRFIRANGLEIAYEHVGEGPPLVLVQRVTPTEAGLAIAWPVPAASWRRWTAHARRSISFAARSGTHLDRRARARRRPRRSGFGALQPGHPGIEVGLREGLADEMLRYLADDEIDAAFCLLAGELRDDMESERLGRDEVVVAFSPRRRSARPASASRSSGRTIVGPRRGSAVTSVVEERAGAMRTARLARKAATCSYCARWRRAVRRGDPVALAHPVGRAARRGTKPRPTRDPRRGAGLAPRAPSSPAARTFIDFVRERLA